jgi:hypothetical protein
LTPKGNPVNDRLIHAHHQRRRNNKLAVLVIDLVHCLGNRMGTGCKQPQLLAVMGDEAINDRDLVVSIILGFLLFLAGVLDLYRRAI